MFNNKFEKHSVAEIIFTLFALFSSLFLLNQSTRIKNYKNDKCNN